MLKQFTSDILASSLAAPVRTVFWSILRSKLVASKLWNLSRQQEHNELSCSLLEMHYLVSLFFVLRFPPPTFHEISGDVPSS